MIRQSRNTLKRQHKRHVIVVLCQKPYPLESKVLIVLCQSESVVRQSSRSDTGDIRRRWRMNTSDAIITKNLYAPDLYCGLWPQGKISRCLHLRPSGLKYLFLQECATCNVHGCTLDRFGVSKLKIFFGKNCHFSLGFISYHDPNDPISTHEWKMDAKLKVSALSYLGGGGGYKNPKNDIWHQRSANSDNLSWYRKGNDVSVN